MNKIKFGLLLSVWCFLWLVYWVLSPFSWALDKVTDLANNLDDKLYNDKFGLTMQTTFNEKKKLREQQKNGNI